LGESYTGIRTLADFSAVVIYTNRPSGVIAYLVATLESANKLSGTVAGDINLVATLVSVNTVHKLEREKRREIIRVKDRSTLRKQPQVVEDVEALPKHPRMRRKAP
jgi:hypothetical protein